MSLRAYTEGWAAVDMVGQNLQHLKYCAERGRWVRWDGKRWEWLPLDAVQSYARTTIEGYAETVRQMANAGQDITFLSRFMKSAARASVWRGMTDAAKTDTRIQIASDAFDSDLYRLTVANGTVDLRNGELGPHDPAHLVTKLAPVAYAPRAHHRKWEHFLEATTAGDKELSAFLQRAVGYTLTGCTAEEKLFFIHGPGATGKTTFTEAIRAMFGDYVRKADFETFLQSKYGRERAVLVGRLAGARLVLSSELERGRRLAEALVKEVSGGEKIAGRELYGATFEYYPTFKLWLVANDVPWVSSDDTGLWRRILRIPFTHVVPTERRDAGLKLALTRDPEIQTAILSWAVEGCLAWQAEGALSVPSTIAASTEAYRTKMDPLATFLDECCVVGNGATVPVTTLRSGYIWYTESAGLRRPIKKHTFNTMIERKFGEQGHEGPAGKRVRVWKGITLNADTAAAVAAGRGYGALDDCSDTDERK